MIKVDGIHKSFGKVRAVRNVSFDAPDGKITGLLGPNGAGKSTTLRILYTVLKPDEGTATIDGVNVVEDSLAAFTQDLLVDPLLHVTPRTAPRRRPRARRARRPRASRRHR